MLPVFIKICFLQVIFKGGQSKVAWEKLRCSTDAEQSVPEGRVPDIGRFPWMGVFQHNFYMGGKERFAITTGILVHPAYAIGSAEDIARIDPNTLENTTTFIVWRTPTTKYSLEVTDYFLHPEYQNDITHASLALVKLFTRGETGVSAFATPVLPVCLPVTGIGVLDSLYAVRMTDNENGELQKEMYVMNYVTIQDCEEFYYKNKLNQKSMAPLRPLCAASAVQNHSCVWEAGAALITRQTWGHWKLLGFSTRGAGCGAPARFLYLHRYLSWMDELISLARHPTRDQEHMIVFRRVSPVQLQMFKGKSNLPKDIGWTCEKGKRGKVIYKDSSELLVNSNFAQGFFFVSVAHLADLKCVEVLLDVEARSNAAIWTEHHCHKELEGSKQGAYFKDVRQRECFAYFKSIMYVELRFFFSFRGTLDVTMYGEDLKPVYILPSPWVSWETTYSWISTYKYLRTNNFIPMNSWVWHM